MTEATTTLTRTGMIGLEDRQALARNIHVAHAAGSRPDQEMAGNGTSKNRAAEIPVRDGVEMNKSGTTI